MKLNYPLIIIILFISSASIGQTAVQSNGLYKNAGLGTTISVTLPGNSTAGDLIIVHVDWGDNTKTITGVKDNNNRTYTAIAGSHITWNTSWSGELFYAYNIGVSPNAQLTVTVTFSGTPAVHEQLYVNEYSGMLSSSDPFSFNNQAAGTATAVSSGSVTTTLANELVYGVAIGGGAGTISVGAGFTSNSAYAITEANIVESQNLIVPGAISATFNNSVNGAPWLAQMAVFQTALSPLPIQLVNFNVNICGDDVCLNWETATETNNDYFTLEKTKDLNNYQDVVKVKGAGNSVRNINYSAKDDNPYQGVSYYRLKQTDYNGAYTYSNLQTLDFNSKDNFSVSVYPNPATSELTVNINNNEESDITLYDITSRKALQQTFVNTITLNTEELAKGIYIYQLKNKNSVLKQGKLVKE